MVDGDRRRPRPMTTVTAQELPGVASTAPEAAEATTPAAKVIDELPCYGECERALDRADQ
jgi:hypothetical protein